MKKLVSAVACLAIATPCFAAVVAGRPVYMVQNINISKKCSGGVEKSSCATPLNARPVYVMQDANTGKRQAESAKSDWYGSLRAELSFLSWKNKYSTDIPNVPDFSEKYSMEPVFTGNFAFGKYIDGSWRAEIEAGYITEFSDTDQGYEIKLSAPYINVNGYYDFDNGLYLGAGAGIAIPRMELLDEQFESGNNPKWSVKPMGGLMIGWAPRLNDNMVLDLRYRLAGFMGAKQTREWVTACIEGNPVGGQHLSNKIDLVLDNSVSIGIRYEF